MITSDISLIVIFFFYGLAFFSMGIAVIIEGDRSADERLRLALRPLAAFGIIHGLNEWIDMFELIGLDFHSLWGVYLWHGIEIGIMAFSFISLAGFGFSLLTPNLKVRRLALLAPLTLTSIWAFGVFMLIRTYPIDLSSNHAVIDAWTRYSLAIPAAISAASGLIAQQRAFRRAGMAEFGRDALGAALAFLWYGVIGQLFASPSRLWPSTYLNSDLFLHLFNFPVQLLRAAMALLVAIYVIRFMRAFDEELRQQIEELREAQLKESQERETLRGELLRRIVAAQEAERQRIARELHDETGQSLTAIGLGLRSVSTLMDRNPEKAKQNLRKVEMLSSNALDELQRLIANLRPAHLDDLGLAPALRWYVNEVRPHINFELKLRVNNESDRKLPDPVKIATYRIVQEAITNTLKHAQADNMVIDICFAPKEIGLVLQDDGVGMSAYHLQEMQTQSWGLLGMRERTTLLGGSFFMETAEGEGMILVITIPYEIPSEDTLPSIENGEKIEVNHDH